MKFSKICIVILDCNYHDSVQMFISLICCNFILVLLLSGSFKFAYYKIFISTLEIKM